MIRSTCCLLLLLTSSAAIAQTRVFQWTDADGVVHFSNEPPPVSVEGVEERTVREAPRPGSVAPTLPTREAAQAPAEVEDTPPRKSPAELARERAERCQQARELITLLEPAYRMINITREDGTTETLTGDLRVAELEKAQALAADNCDN